MNLFEKIVYFLQAEMEAPGNFGWFHIMMFCIIAAMTAAFILAFKDANDKTFRRVILAVWIIQVVLEIYCQLVFALDSDGVTATWDYAWYMFPFQFCSSPIYTLPFIAFLKDGDTRDGFISFTGTFALFGGLAVMVYPNDVFIGMIGINIQTMLHHGLQVVIGVLCMVHQRRKLNHAFFFKGVPVFVTLVLSALVLDIVVYEEFLRHGISDTFNMYFISPYFECTLPVLSAIRPFVSYPVFLAVYIFGFTAIAAIMYYIQRGFILKATGVVPHLLPENYSLTTAELKRKHRSSLLNHHEK